MKILLRLLLRLLFQFRVYGTEALATPGPVLLISNHVSWIDWLFLGVCLDDDWRFVTSLEMVKRGRRWMRPIIDNRRTFPVDNLSPFAVKRMAEYLQQGGRLVLFAEGRLSRTGALMKLFDGTGFLLHKTGAKVVVAYLRGAHRLPASPNRDRKAWFPGVTAHFSQVLTPPVVEHLGSARARTRLTRWLRDRMNEQRFEAEMQFGASTPAEAILRTARERGSQVALEDVNGKLTYRRLCLGAELLARNWIGVLHARQDSADPTASATGATELPRVGVLLPNISSLPVTLISLWLTDRVPAVLNYSSGTGMMLACARLARLRQIITSRAFLERARLKAEDFTQAGIELVYLEDIRQRISGRAKIAAWIRQRCGLRPATGHLQPEATAVILFTSGSEGMPKGVALSHRSMLANVQQVLAVTDLSDHDRMFNALPLFHSFGLTFGMLAPLIRGFFVFLYPSPLHYRVVPTIFYDRDCTIMLGTNTFLNGYARKAHAYDFRSLRYLFAAAEKLQEATAATWAQRFGVRVLEGYGATECSPCVSVCTPLEPRHGSTGRLLPGMEYRLEPVEGVTGGGRLFVRGPNVMRGYLNPDADAHFQALGGWYDTGDIASVDDEGFVRILGRLKRFAKISGEMVSLTAVEDALAGAFPQYGLRCQVAVVTRPDADKGEVLIAVSNEPRLTLEEIRSAIRARGLPNLCVPREVKFLREIPKLGTGKVNHRELQTLLQ